MRLGPGAMVAAAFIGPGTVTTAATAGASSGIALLWAVLFSIVATLVLQELALKSALVTQRDLASLMRSLGENKWWGPWLMLLIVMAVGLGNAAYQSGNLSGAGLGLSEAFGLPMTAVIVASAVIAGILIYLNNYQLLERVLVALVALMAVLFCTLAILLLPELFRLPQAMLIPSFSLQQLTLILALIGTTVVPYNLFLHATAARKRWINTPLEQALIEARREARISIIIGGVITASIVVVASVSLHTSSSGVIHGLAEAMNQQFPHVGHIMVGIGLFAAGITSSIAAPMAAGWAVCGALGWQASQRSKWIALAVLMCGAFFAVITTSPAALIISAQVSNGILLPIIAIALMLVANSKMLGKYRNDGRANWLAGFVVIIVSLLAVRKLIGLL